MKYISLLMSFLSTSLCKQIPVYLALQQRNLPVLEDHLREISDPTHSRYGQWMHQTEIDLVVHPPLKDQRRVVDWVHSYPVHDVVNHGDAVHFRANTTTLQDMFDMDTLDMHHYVIPEDLRDIVVFAEMMGVSTLR